MTVGEVMEKYDADAAQVWFWILNGTDLGGVRLVALPEERVLPFAGATEATQWVVREEAV